MEAKSCRDAFIPMQQAAAPCLICLPNEYDRPLVASRRFYQVCQERRIRTQWMPVRIEDRGKDRGKHLMNATVLMDLCHRRGLGRIAEVILAIARPAAHLELEPAPDSEIPPRGSRFGGTPDLPPQTVWPRKRSGRMLTFVMQIDLRTVHSWFGQPGTFPDQGMLYFFLDAAEPPLGSLEEFDAFAIRHAADVESVRPFPQPRPLRNPDPNPRPILPSARVRAMPVLTLPQPADIWDVIAPTNDERIAYSQMYSKDYLAWFQGKPRHQLGGHAQELQQGGCLRAARMRAGLLDIPRQHPAMRDIKSVADGWRLALQLDSDDRLHGSWRYGGDRLYFWAFGPSMRSGSFDRCWVTTDVD